MFVKIIIGVAATLAALPCGLGLYMWVRWYRLRKRMTKRLDHYLFLREEGVDPFTALTRARQLFPWHYEESFDWEVLMSERVWESRSQNSEPNGATEHGSSVIERERPITTLTQFEVDNLADGERSIFLERAKEGKELTREELESLRLLNYGNRRFGKPSHESLRRMKMTPREIAYEMTGNLRYAPPLSERIAALLGTATGVAVLYVLPVFGVIFLWHWLRS